MEVVFFTFFFLSNSFAENIAQGSNTWSFNWNEAALRHEISLNHLPDEKKFIAKNIIKAIDSSSSEFKNIFKLKFVRPLLIKMVEEKEFKNNYSTNNNVDALFLNGVLAIKVKKGRINSKLNKIIRHEIAHVFISDSTGGKQLPAWFEEGLSQYLEGGQHHNRIQDLKRMKTHEERIILKEIQTNLSLHRMPQIAYAQSLFLVRSIIRSYGFSKIRSFFDYVKKGVLFENAFEKAFGVSLEKYEKKVNKQLNRWLNCYNCPL